MLFGTLMLIRLLYNDVNNIAKVMMKLDEYFTSAKAFIHLNAGIPVSARPALKFTGQ